jgi:hypothetical protein
MFFILTGFVLLAVVTMATFTWLFVDWLFPPKDFGLKLLTLCFFDIAAFFWACMELFSQPATEGTNQIIIAGMIVDLLLSISTTVAYFIVAYAFEFSPLIPVANLVLLMDIVVTIAVVFNTVMLVCFFSAEWRIRHPKTYLYSTPQAPVYSLPQTTVVEVRKPVVEPVEVEEVSTNKPVYSTDSSTNKNIPPAEVSTNKKKLPPLQRREFLGGKNRTKSAD